MKKAAKQQAKLAFVSLMWGAIFALFVMISGCSVFDDMSYQHAKEAQDSIERLLPDSKLPESAKAVIRGQAIEWVKYESPDKGE